MGLQEVPEHEAPLQAGKGKRTETGTGKYRKERKCSLNPMLKKTILRKKLDTTRVPAQTRLSGIPQKKKWTTPLANWSLITQQLCIWFEDRFKIL